MHDGSRPRRPDRRETEQTGGKKLQCEVEAMSIIPSEIDAQRNTFGRPRSQPRLKSRQGRFLAIIDIMISSLPVEVSKHKKFFRHFPNGAYNAQNYCFSF